MTLAIVRVVLTAAAGYGLWRLWRSVAATDPRAKAIVGAGFLLRALVAQALFWISWLKLPIATSLQAGNGFWFFALDGPTYLEMVNNVLAKGPLAILNIDAVYPSHVFIQLVAVCVMLFGGVAALAILVNCAAYLGTCAVILRLAGDGARVGVPGLFALTAVAFGPGAVLWSLQLLKDTVLIFLMVAIIAGYAYWQKTGLDARDSGLGTRASGRPAVIAGMAACYFGLAGIRWYFALVILAASVPCAAVVAWRSPRRIRVALVSALAILLFSQAIRFGGDSDVPRAIREVLALDPAVLAEWSPIGMANTLTRVRIGFQNTSASTTIVAGSALASESSEPVTPRKQTPFERERSVGAARTNRGTAGETPGDIVADLGARFALFMFPRFIVEPTGIARVGGSRGLWLFAELDTMAFDLVLLVSMVLCWRSLRSAAVQVTPLFVLLVLTCVLLLPPVLYTINNFGTLFRMRQMLYVLVALAPLSLALRAKPSAEAIARS